MPVTSFWWTRGRPRYDRSRPFVVELSRLRYGSAARATKERTGMATAVNHTERVVSADGTEIAVTVTGRGAPLVVAPGSLATAEHWQGLADALGARMTTYVLDRRGHGRSGDGPEYSMDHEQDDLNAVLALAGEDAIVMGHSYGALIALGSALRRPPARLIVYEPPLPLDGPIGGAAIEAYADLVDAGDMDEALAFGIRSFVRAPEDAVALLRGQPIWGALAALAPTWTRELRAIDTFPADIERFRGLATPTLLLTGELSPPWLIDVSRRLADVLPNATHVTFPGQGHDAHAFAPETVAHEIARFAAQPTAATRP